MCLRSRESPKKTQRNGQQWIRSTGGGGVWGVPYILMRHIIVRPCQAGTLVIVYIVCLDTTSIIRNRTFVLKPHLLVATSAWQPGIFVRKDRKRNGNSQKMLRVSLTLIIITSFNIVTSSKGKKIPRFCWKCIFNPTILWLPTWKASNSLQQWNQKDLNQTSTTRFLPNPTRAVFKIHMSSNVVVWLGWLGLFRNNGCSESLQMFARAHCMSTDSVKYINAQNLQTASKCIVLMPAHENKYTFATPSQTEFWSLILLKHSKVPWATRSQHVGSRSLHAAAPHWWRSKGNWQRVAQPSLWSHSLLT